MIDRLQKLTGIDVLENYDPFAYDECLLRLLTQLKKQEKSVLVGIDDIKISDDIRAFASEYQILIGNEFDISLLMAGMPADIAEVQNDHAISFLLRSNRIQL